MSISRNMQMATSGTAGGGGNSGLASTIIPFGTNGTSASYMHFIDSTDGTVYGSVNMGSNGLKGPYSYRYGNYFYIFPKYDSASFKKIDTTNNYSVSTGSVTANIGFGGFTPISSTELFRMNPVNNYYQIFNMANGSSSLTNYTAAGSSAYAQTHGTLSFFDNGTSGVTNAQSPIWWSGHDGGSGYASNLYYASLSGTTLGTKAHLSGAGNYSRNYVSQVDKDKGIFYLFDNTMFAIDRATNTRQQISVQNLSYGGNSLSRYGPQAYQTGLGMGTGTRSHQYGLFRRFHGSNQLELRVGMYDPFQGVYNPAPTDLFGITTSATIGYYYYSIPQIVCVTVSTAGHVVFIYEDWSINGNTLRLKCFLGSTQVGSDVLITLPSSQAGNNTTNNKLCPSTASYNGPLPQ